MLSSPQFARFSDGERFPYLEDQEGLMSLWPTLFTLVKLRRVKAANTIANELAAISHLHVWQRLEKRDLLQEFAQQQFPTEADIESLRDHCYRDAIDLRRFMDRAKNLPKNSIELTAPIKSISLQTVGQVYAYNRITTVAEYLYFCANTMLQGRPNKGELNKRAEKMRKDLLATRKKGKSKSRLAAHPAPQFFDEFMLVVAQDSPDNPFKSREVRLRNYVIFQCFFETGMRSGELLSLYVGDILYDDEGDPIVRIVDRRDDPNDPRPNPPQVKTLERDIPISTDLYDKIQEYISVRYSTPNARKYPFLFVNHRHDKSQGFPMSDKNLQLELKRVVAVRPDRFKDIRRHGFRSNFNVSLTDKLDLYSIKENSLNPQERLDIRKNLNGHDGDKSGDVYEQNAVRAKAKKAVRQYQGKQSAVLKKAVAAAKGHVSDDDN
jgi:integrase